MATQIEVPALGESVTQAILVKWHKEDGQTVAVDEPLCELETDKANVDIPARTAGIVHRLKAEGETVNVGDVIARIDDSPAVATTEPVTPTKAETSARPAPQPGEPARIETPAPAPTAAAAVRAEDLSPAVRRIVEEHRLDPSQIPATGPRGRLTKEDVQNHLARSQAPAEPAAPWSPPAPPGVIAPTITPAARPASPTPSSIRPDKPAPSEKQPQGEPVLTFDAKGERRVPMSRIRKRIAETLVKAQQTAAILTTFNEVDLTEVIALRNKFKERFQEVHGVGLGFMSFFARAVVLGLKEIPRLNAFLEGDQVIYHNYVNLGIAVSTDRGLAVPVLRNVHEMSFAKVESEIKRVATAVREGKLGLEELSGGTFSITNGGVFGSLLSTPILTPPQSGILGMHSIQKRPVVIDDRIEVRSMMYLALSYDHRLVDGKEAITFLVRVKQLLEDPARLMLEI